MWSKNIGNPSNGTLKNKLYLAEGWLDEYLGEEGLKVEGQFNA